MTCELLPGRAGAGGASEGAGAGAGSALDGTTWGFWLGPLPPDGPVTVAVDWPALDLPEQRFTFDGSMISAAAARSTEIWPRGEDGTAGRQASWTIRF